MQSNSRARPPRYKYLAIKLAGYAEYFHAAGGLALPLLPMIGNQVGHSNVARGRVFSKLSVSCQRFRIRSTNPQNYG
jgi:hypothetical protein